MRWLNGDLEGLSGVWEMDVVHISSVVMIYDENEMSQLRDTRKTSRCKSAYLSYTCVSQRSRRPALVTTSPPDVPGAADASSRAIVHVILPLYARSGEFSLL